MSKLADVVEKGNRRASLEAIRDRLASELEPIDIDGRTVAVLAKELRAVLAELDKLPGGEEESDLDRIAASIPQDELASRRKGRVAGAKAPPRP